MTPLDFFIWIFLLLFTVISLFIWLLKKRTHTHVKSYDTRERVALYTVPRVVLVWIGFLFGFLIFNLSKGYLLLIFPIAYLVVNFKMTQKVLSEDEEGL